MKNIDVWASEVQGKFTVFNYEIFNIEKENPIIRYFSDYCCGEEPEKIKEKAKQFIEKKYEEFEKVGEVERAYNNIIKNIENAVIESI